MIVCEKKTHGRTENTPWCYTYIRENSVMFRIASMYYLQMYPTLSTFGIRCDSREAIFVDVLASCGRLVSKGRQALATFIPLLVETNYNKWNLFISS